MLSVVLNPDFGKLRAWEIDGKGKFPKVLRGGCIVQKVFWTQGAKVSEKSFAPPKTAFALVQNGVALVQKALCSLGPKDLLHPPPTQRSERSYF